MQKNYMLICLLFLLSCRSINGNDLNPRIKPIINLLPKLEIKTDVSAYLGTNFYSNILKEDAQNIFIKEVQENIIEQSGKTKGYIEMRITYFNCNSNPLYQMSGFFLYIPSILGMPFDNSECTTEIEVTIQNNGNNTVKHYAERATDTEYAAFYWGYDNFDFDSVTRKASAESLKQALEIIRYRINEDADEIINKLK